MALKLAPYQQLCCESLSPLLPHDSGARVLIWKPYKVHLKLPEQQYSLEQRGFADSIEVMYRGSTLDNLQPNGVSNGTG